MPPGVLEGGRRRGFAKHRVAPPEPARLARRAVDRRPPSKLILPPFGRQAETASKPRWQPHASRPPGVCAADGLAAALVPLSRWRERVGVRVGDVVGWPRFRACARGAVGVQTALGRLCRHECCHSPQVQRRVVDCRLRVVRVVEAAAGGRSGPAHPAPARCARPHQRPWPAPTARRFAPSVMPRPFASARRSSPSAATRWP
jgi:hypothetical protein